MSWAFNSWNNEITWKHQKEITKDQNGENVPYLEVEEVALIH